MRGAFVGQDRKVTDALRARPARTTGRLRHALTRSSGTTTRTRPAPWPPPTRLVHDAPSLCLRHPEKQHG
ncbi:MAG: hypothetical protein JF598_27415 [Streptomyces sp.]|nr:hypothetical protein [Streptomyces sp.]